jgi:pimeloyl-ACP methyl ester carboxylesterase
VLLFLHGFPEAAFIWDELLEHFARPSTAATAAWRPTCAATSAPASRPTCSLPRQAPGAGHRGADRSRGAPLACLVAHDWGGAVAWNFANQLPQLTRKLAIVNSPHPGTFLRELQTNPRSSRPART